MSKHSVWMGRSFSLVALLASVAMSCGDLPEGPVEAGDLQQRSEPLGQQLIYVGIVANQVGRDCSDPKSTAGTAPDWKWRITRVPSDFVPVLMRSTEVGIDGYWRPSAVPQYGDPDNGRCDTRLRWPLVFEATYDSATDTNTWVLWTEPLYAGDPKAGSSFSLHFIDSGGQTLSFSLAF